MRQTLGPDADLADPLPGTFEYAAAEQRAKSAYDISMVHLPQGPDDWAYDIYERVDHYERALVAPHRHRREYLEGTAQVSDEIAIIEGTGNFLLTAEHATKTVRLGDDMPYIEELGTYRSYLKTVSSSHVGHQDVGTAGLVAALAEQYGTGFVMRGLQTSSPPIDPDHPMKALIRNELYTATGFAAVHGMGSGKFMHPYDQREVQASLGLGLLPSEELHTFAEKIVQLSKDVFDLNVVIGNDADFFVQKQSLTALERNPDGTPYRNRLAALHPFSTTNFSHQELAAINRSSVPALQVELSWLLRPTLLDSPRTKDKKSEVIGVALGYKLLETIIQQAEHNTLR